MKREKHHTVPQETQQKGMPLSKSEKKDTTRTHARTSLFRREERQPLPEFDCARVDVDQHNLYTNDHRK